MEPAGMMQIILNRAETRVSQVGKVTRASPVAIRIHRIIKAAVTGMELPLRRVYRAEGSAVHLLSQMNLMRMQKWPLTFMWTLQEMLLVQNIRRMVQPPQMPV